MLVAKVAVEMDSLQPLSDLVDLGERVIVVTGAAKGLGVYIAARVAEAGAAVVLFDLDEEAAQQAASRMPGGRALAVGGDVSSEEDVARACAATIAAFGRVDALVNNAGIYPQVPFLESDATLWERVFRVNMVGTMLCSRVFSARLIEQGNGGTIVNVLSRAAVRPQIDSFAAYGASKAGMLNFTQVLARSLAPHRVRVNALLPGSMDTPGITDSPTRRPATEIPLGHRAHPDEVARAALFLLSDLSVYMTGSALLVDGGIHLV